MRLRRYGRLYRMLRAIRYVGRRPRWYRRYLGEVSFYGQLVPPDALCFDVGANVGEKTMALRELGATVVAVEPEPTARQRLLEEVGGDPRVTVVPKAVGRRPGRATLHVGSNTKISSLSPDWIEMAAKTERLTGQTWTHTVEVAVTTLDELIATFGLPDFCKVDIEGFEVEVIGGLTHPVPALSFEFHPEALSAVDDIVTHLSTLGPYEFNYSYHAPLRWGLDRWVDASALRQALEASATREPEMYGDVFAVIPPVEATRRPT